MAESALVPFKSNQETRRPSSSDDDDGILIDQNTVKVKTIEKNSQELNGI